MKKNFKNAIDKTNLAQKGIAALIGGNNVNTDNTSNINNTGNTSNTGNIRQTFVLSPQDLEKLKDYVHYRRLQGETDFSQKRALNEALGLLFKTVPDLPTRTNK